MLDIHTHLYWKSYDVDRDVVVARAREAGVTKMICVGTEPEDNPLAVGVAEKYEDVYASIGLHPHYFNESGILNLESRIKELRELAKHEKVIAIGECGLDYYSHPASAADGDKTKVITDEQKTLAASRVRGQAIQKEGFIAQLELAKELQLPLIIHTRPSAGTMDAYEDLLDILKANEAKELTKLKAVILHCYMGDTEVTKKFLELSNVYFSFAGNITYGAKKVLVGTKPARIDTRSVSGRDDLIETVKLIPLERLFVETDCPFLAPQSKRGKRNEPAFVCETAEFLAQIKGISSEELNRFLNNNFFSAFGEDVL